uniref:Gamma-glutamyltranspeptidase n=1 Tax=Panagrolaimus sp. ES5 TaxID=591445 RepID=A0AC34FD32_9BILA
MIEFQKFAYAQRTLLGDGDYVPDALELAKNMTKKSWILSTYEKLQATAQPSTYYGGIAWKSHPEDHGTSHVSTIDEYGNGVAATTTINRWFGASVQSSLGVIWNDEMDDFSTPGMENGFGFAPSETNYIVPGKRPMSSMSPLIIYNEETGKIKMVVGASGGSKIISAVSRPIVRVLCFNQTIKEAIDAPSLHNQFTPDITQFEGDVPPQLIKDLETKFGQKFKPTTGFEGIVQAIVVDEKDGYIYANGDWRRKTPMHAEGY